MKSRLFLGALVCIGLAGATAEAQIPETVITEASGSLDETPLDDIVQRTLMDEKPVLPYDPVREADIFWEKRIWRVIDVREKMNQAFTYPDRPFATILLDAAKEGDITVYSTEDDKFSYPLTMDEVTSQMGSVDTIQVFDPETYETKTEIVANDLDPADIKRFRIKEVWFFDEESSTMQTRILGIAPLKDEKDDNGDVLFEAPMFWVYYPEARQILAREKVFNPNNDASPTSWEDLFEMRYFSSYIFKQSNVQDRRLQEYLTGVDMLLEGEKIKQEIFNFEQDLWSY